MCMNAARAECGLAEVGRAGLSSRFVAIEDAVITKLGSATYRIMEENILVHWGCVRAARGGASEQRASDATS